MDELYLDNIDEYVNDHNKIVTYKWLSLTLGVHVNTAKQMLFHYLDHKRKESSAQLHATYLVSGKCEDNGHSSHKVSVVREEQLEDFKAKMSLIVSVHVYSVQKALLKDSGPLYSVDYDAVKDNLKDCSRFSAIRCANATPLSSAELQQAREQQQQQQQQQPTPEPQNRPTNGHAKPPAKQQKGIMGMFGNKAAAPKKQEKVEPKQEEAPPAPVDTQKSKAPAKTSPMMNFFGSQTAKKPEKVKQEEAAASSSTSTEQQVQTEKKQEAAAAAAAAAAPEPAKDKKKKESRSKTKRMEDSDSEDDKMEKKKRRRIKKPEPDSSDEDVIPDSPPQLEARQQPPPPPPPPSPPPSPKKEAEPVPHSHQGSSDTKIRRRRRVLKSHTFIDDEGCIVTEKGYESESYSEAEDEAPPPKQAAKAPAKPAASHRDEEKKSHKKSAAAAAAGANKGTKQASIMGFFHKK